MKGERIFNETVRTLFGVEERQEVDVQGIGRDPELILERNEHIMHRYYYYLYFTDKRMPAVYKMLRQEFYLSEVTLNKIVMEHGSIRRRLMAEKPTIGDMRKKYPLSVW